MTNEQLACALRNGMFASRNSIREAYDYANEIALATDNPAAVTTAIHVMMNAIADTLDRVLEENK